MTYFLNATEPRPVSIQNESGGAKLAGKNAAAPPSAPCTSSSSNGTSTVSGCAVRMDQAAYSARAMVHPNHIIYRKMEGLIKQMLDPEAGVPIKTVKSFLSKIPSVFTGMDTIAWILRSADVADIADALHLAHMLASHGYIFQIDDHVLTVKNDGTFYRFQTPYFWPSNCWEPENTDYAVYLCKRTMQNKAHLELEDFEAENLAKLQKMFSRKWEFVFMQAEAQYKVDKKRDRLERQILDSQERAFWDVHRPVPGCVNTTEVDFRKLSRAGRPKYSASNTSMLNAAAAAGFNNVLDGNCGTSGGQPQVLRCSPNQDAVTVEKTLDNGGRHYLRPGLRRCTLLQDSIKHEITLLQGRLSQNVLKTSKIFENYQSYFEQRKFFDCFIFPLGSTTDPFQSHANPWISDTIDFWQHDKSTGDISTRRLKLWELSFEELLNDQLGRETLQKFLDKEYSGENLRFWLEVQKLRKCSSRMVPVLVTEIYNEFIDSNATSPVNIDCKVMEITEENLHNNPNRWSFDEAAEHICALMKNDSYQRFLRSDMYRDMVNLSRKKSSLSALISRKTSRKVPAPRSLSSKSANSCGGGGAGGGGGSASLNSSFTDSTQPAQRGVSPSAVSAILAANPSPQPRTGSFRSVVPSPKHSTASEPARKASMNPQPSNSTPTPYLQLPTH
ncbi:unnamed protein product [Bursaphelenchus okinawaensis]|uniref:Uncharacterized protein n=1 Tax=Bursaphelenchus okinawaensis TaxID=465554 RepID=A0A811K5T7_9BILA|nr:unnamed protein product [Bursaphelenchus okinawaensis]CAG9092023.1 unnamed protein product [Bursaphelenchus okinawaensis]